MSDLEDRDGDDQGDQQSPDQAPPAEPEAPKRQPITVSEMALVIVVEAMRREQNAKAIEKVFGPDHAPSEQAQREIEVLFACARFLDTIAPIMPTIRATLKDRARKKN